MFCKPFNAGLNKIINHVLKNSVRNESNLISLLKRIPCEMPQSARDTEKLKEQRLKQRNKKSKYVSAVIKLQVLGSGAKGAPRCLYFNTDSTAFLFNCGEGSQRLAIEHKMKLSRVEHIFITYPSWENLGGLPGIALTVQDVGVPDLTLHGPEGLNEIFNATENFVKLKFLSTHTAKCNPEINFRNNSLEVQYVAISGELPLENSAVLSNSDEDLSDRSPEAVYNESEFDDDTDYYQYENNRKSPPKKRKQSSSREREKQECLLPGTKCMSYIIKLFPKVGTLSLEKCLEFGVPPGPLLGKLKAKEDVILDDGRIVKASDVLSPDEPGPIFIVVECPSEHFLQSFIQEKAFLKHQSIDNNTLDDAPRVIVHFTPPSIIDNPLYKDWMKKFPSSTYHLILNEDNDCMGSTSVHEMQYKLNILDKNIFPALRDEGIAIDSNYKKAFDVDNADSIEISIEHSDLDNVELIDNLAVLNGKTLWKGFLRPKLIFSRSKSLKINLDELRENIMSMEGFQQEYDKLQCKISNLNEIENITEYPNIVFLGTGSSIPSKNRNTSAIHINLNENSNVLLDCGENTYGQIVRFYGRDYADNVIKRMKAVFISHLHADHHLGLVGILKTRRKLNLNDSIYLIAPKQIMKWLFSYHNNFEKILYNVHLIPNSDIVYYQHILNKSMYNKLLTKLNFSKIETAPVKHCPNSFAVAITLNSGFKISYSGDTMPCEHLCKLAQNSDLLIHEATMADELIDQAVLKLHSTTSQAIEMGKLTDSKFTLLTHFSQRYSKVPVYNENFTNNVGIAFDYMKIRLNGDLNKLPLFPGCLRIMFQEYFDEMEMRSFKRELKKEHNR